MTFTQFYETLESWLRGEQEMSILEDIDTSQWSEKELKAALNFLYGDVDKFFEAIQHLHTIGDHKPRTAFRGGFDDNDEPDVR